MCSTNVCDRNAECTNQEGKNYRCKCKDGYQGNGMLCTPVNPCDTDNGGCPANSTSCVYVSPGKQHLCAGIPSAWSTMHCTLSWGCASAVYDVSVIPVLVCPLKSRCECKSGMEGSSPSLGCRLKNVCVENSCHRTAECQTGPDGDPICTCSKQQIGDGKRCYGNIMERILELNREDSLKGRLSGSITSFGNNEAQTSITEGMPAYLVKTGASYRVRSPPQPFSCTIPDSIFCKNHVILGQRLISELEREDHWLLSGNTASFQNSKRFTITQSPFQNFGVILSNIPAANGIIHVIETSLITTYSAGSEDDRIAKMSIGDFLASNPDYNRFQSLLDNCGAALPLKSPGPLTVFVPSNDAVDRARDGSIMYMLTKVTVDQLAGMSEFQSMAHETITVNVSSDGRLSLSDKGINLESRDIIASNGIIHVIDGVLVPPSIVPILPHRCDVTDSKIVLMSHMRDCEYSASPLSSLLSSKGCAKYCNTTTVRPECCKGFYGPDCKPCIGGFDHPCYNKGTCNDGIKGDGSCSCAPRFTGIACHICSDPKKHGDNCDEDCRCVHGECDNRPGSNGVCRQGSCQQDYSGDLCNLVAQCVFAGPGNTSCLCNEGWTGDGLVCAEINNCLLSTRGGCHANADCTATAPGQELAGRFDFITFYNLIQEVMVQNATIIIPDIRASNGYIHVINMMLQPPLSDIPPPPPNLMEFLNGNPAFSLFSRAVVFYNLTDQIEAKKYTILIPTNEAIKEHLDKTNSTELDEDTVKYHVIVDAQLFPKDLRTGLLKTTLLGSSYQIMFHTGTQNESFANDVLLNGNFSETKNGIVTGVSKILEIHKNFCNKEIALKVRGRCGACDEVPKCSYLSAKPDHTCCLGYFGHTCLKCPGKPGSWCSNNGKCLDGYNGSGECQCDEGYNGTACETCKPGRFGHDCKSACNCNHGRCLDGIDGDGSCLCYKGWRGPTCSVAALRVHQEQLLPAPVSLVTKATESLAKVESWDNASRINDLLRYHVVACEQLMLSDLKSSDKIITLSGYPLTFTVREGVVYVNNEAKIITSDYTTSNGVMHFIDKVLVPYDLKSKSDLPPVSLNVTAAAEAYGYHVFSKLLQNPVHHPFTMLWPKDEVFNSFPEERKKWLYSADHKDKLAAYMKAHIVRDTKLTAANLPSDESVRTMYGSTISFSCDKKVVGDILVDAGNAKIVERHLEFNVGIAHGIDQVLEPPDLGARCDTFTEIKLTGRCGSCAFTPSCPYGFSYLGNTKPCRYNRYPSVPYYRRRFYDLYNYNFPNMYGCEKECGKSDWVPQCCKNHYGQNCQVCPGGLEAPCSNQGTCDDGKRGTGNCMCHGGFTGTACELCATNHYGPNCTAHGKCDGGLEGDGSCFCQEGWTGDQCQLKLAEKPICSPECHPNAVCQPGNTCQCELLYEGDGRNCTAPDLCSEYNGGCHTHANCTQVGVNITCTCLPGYTGDGVSCSAINRCVQEPNGGCSDFAKCTFTGPNERQCECLPGYVGNGIQCLEKVVPPVDRCLEDNGGCDPKAICKDLHFHENTAGVYHLRSPAGKYKLNYTDAIASCEAEQAKLANLSQLSDAQQLGMHLCVAGWLDGGKVGYPIIYPSAKCGDNHVGIVLYRSPVRTNSTYDAYCYRVKDVSCECGPGYVGDGYFCNGDLASIVATNANFSTFYSILLNYSSSAKGKDLMAILSTPSTSVTLFVPQNSGFYPNETWSGRDMEYHISTNNNIHFYNSLEHNSIIPSRLGYNLSVMVSSSPSVSNPSKLVNKRLIVDWDIPAINGIIHVIEGPLKAPPPPVRPHVRPDSRPANAHSHMTALTSVLVLVLVAALVAGLVFYIVKHKNDPFRFHYFRDNEDEDSKPGGECSPTLVSIPNPLYSGHSTGMEPFDVKIELERFFTRKRQTSMIFICLWRPRTIFLIQPKQTRCFSLQEAAHIKFKNPVMDYKTINGSSAQYLQDLMVCYTPPLLAIWWFHKQEVQNEKHKGVDSGSNVVQ
ncbi:stabilin-1-like [Scleropages formosus]|uniref:Stabilin-1-like n=1 Tax=Scleropages formosus TaxID=113540 RepID=A0A0P7YJA3_SCLFO|nr:stabilin-1-like [Scleropages formosus]